MADEMQKHLDNARYGTKLNPDEQRQYLGTFRERVYLTLTVAEMEQKAYSDALVSEIKKHPEAHLLIKGSLNDDLQAKYVTLASTNKFRFTIISDPEFTDNSTLGAVVAAKTAVNESVVAVAEKYPQKTSTEPPKEPEPEGFFKRLFH